MKITLLTGKTYDLQKHFDFPLQVNHSKLAKRLTLRIDSQKRIPVVTIPKRCSEKRAVEFVETHRLWILKSLQSIPEIKRFEPNIKINLFGADYIIVHNPELKRGCFIEGDKIYVSGEESFLHRRVKDFIKDYAKKELDSLSREKARILGKKLNNVCLKDTKSRWGSCSSNNNINYSWRIALAPYAVIEYLVCHEVAHLAEQNHSIDFWNKVKELCPNYKNARLWLKKYGKELYLYE